MPNRSKATRNEVVVLDDSETEQSPAPDVTLADNDDNDDHRTIHDDGDQDDAPHEPHDNDDDDEMDPELQERLLMQIHYATDLGAMTHGDNENEDGVVRIALADPAAAAGDMDAPPAQRGVKRRRAETPVKAVSSASASATASGTASPQPGADAPAGSSDGQRSKRGRLERQTDVGDGIDHDARARERRDADELFFVVDTRPALPYRAADPSESDSDDDVVSGSSSDDDVQILDDDDHDNATSTRKPSTKKAAIDDASSNSSKKPAGKTKRERRAALDDDEDFDFNELVTRARAANEAARLAELDGATHGLFSAFSKNIRASMANLVDPNLWKIQEDDLKLTLNAARTEMGRYFVGFDAGRIRCHNCDQMGHISRDCPNKRRVSPCYLCGEPGHTRFKCPNQTCYACFGAGHMMRDCRRRAAKPHILCRRCKMRGHFEANCTDVWRQYHHQHAALRESSCRDFLGFPNLRDPSGCSVQSLGRSNQPVAFSEADNPSTQDHGDEEKENQSSSEGGAPFDVAAACKQFLRGERYRTFCCNCGGDDHLMSECGHAGFDYRSTPGNLIVSRYDPVRFRDDDDDDRAAGARTQDSKRDRETKQASAEARVEGGDGKPGKLVPSSAPGRYNFVWQNTKIRVPPKMLVLQLGLPYAHQLADWSDTAESRDKELKETRRLVEQAELQAKDVKRRLEKRSAKMTKSARSSSKANKPLARIELMRYLLQIHGDKRTARLRASHDQTLVRLHRELQSETLLQDALVGASADHNAGNNDDDDDDSEDGAEEQDEDNTSSMEHSSYSGRRNDPSVRGQARHVDAAFDRSRPRSTVVGSTPYMPGPNRGFLSTRTSVEELRGVTRDGDSDGDHDDETFDRTEKKGRVRGKRRRSDDDEDDEPHSHHHRHDEQRSHHSHHDSQHHHYHQEHEDADYYYHHDQDQHQHHHHQHHHHTQQHGSRDDSRQRRRGNQGPGWLRENQHGHRSQERHRQQSDRFEDRSRGGHHHHHQQQQQQQHDHHHHHDHHEDHHQHHNQHHHTQRSEHRHQKHQQPRRPQADPSPNWDRFQNERERAPQPQSSGSRYRGGYNRR
ncbi:hypothetical protein CAOG_01319 [Capsaspora owczarzaki ATCC 30864]|uniref:CCHC-type domain-containing protein n=1 Tax=Capsaspora owczarzaki (strain ATCC 30864) TaxID=595528 RepID=A0A0D2WK41_CAPO3|nr:hypothetical protein CAOG_01319 [Capsaspora owczarzaki ATCC 30864]KJE89918.1 hypothetical protein CAOG_001319 [Capsaspora owczarzaki ATCC 30864]|eukprot:XP_004349839.1 hypothetical protein CAOG_01319 [Capsaspora owczarzaki ATCC 30864]